MQVTSRHNNDERKEVSGSFFFKLLQNQANAVFIGKFGSNSGLKKSVNIIITQNNIDGLIISLFSMVIPSHLFSRSLKLNTKSWGRVN